MKYMHIACLGCGVLLFASGVYMGRTQRGEELTEASPQEESASTQMVREREAGYTFISPILDCESASMQRGGGAGIMYRELETQLRNLTQRFAVPTMSVYYRDLTNGPWFGIDFDEEFAPASMTKVPLMIAVYKEAERSPNFLDREATISEEVASLNAEENIRATQVVEAGATYAIRDLVRRMIVYSDNAAAVTLLSIVEPKAIEEVFLQIGVPVDMVGNDIALSVKEYASFYRVLFNASYLNRDSSEQALTLLAETEFREGLVAGVASEVSVAHKFGERKRDDLPVGERIQLHDCGIVYYPGQ